jgi:hypothetical protein
MLVFSWLLSGWLLCDRVAGCYATVRLWATTLMCDCMVCRLAELCLVRVAACAWLCQVWGGTEPDCMHVLRCGLGSVRNDAARARGAYFYRVGCMF